VGVIGNKNAGKTFFLEKLSGYNIPKGFNVKTIGLSVRYGTTPDHNVAILDSAGQETPLLKIEVPKIDEKKIELKDEKENDEKENQNGISENENDAKKEEQETNEPKKKNEDIENEKDNEFEEYSRDKLITEFFLQKFIIWKSDIIILVVGNISLTEQKLLYTVKQEAKNLAHGELYTLTLSDLEYSYSKFIYCKTSDSPEIGIGKYINIKKICPMILEAHKEKAFLIKELELLPKDSLVHIISPPYIEKQFQSNDNNKNISNQNNNKNLSKVLITEN